METKKFITLSITARHSPCPEPDESNPHPQTYHPKIQFNNILPSTAMSSQLSISLRLSNQSVYSFIIFLMNATCLAHLILLDSIILISLFGEEYKLLYGTYYHAVFSSLSSFHTSFVEIFS
jgi:uncharacterized membrane protein